MQGNPAKQAVRYGLLRLALVTFATLHAPLTTADNYVTERLHLIQLIEQDVKATSAYLQKEVLDPRVLEVMATVPRHEFVSDELKSFAYRNTPLPIGHGQTISQPYIVAIMTDLLAVKSDSKVLEIGTGSGYQAAIMAELVSMVFSIEIIKPLGQLATDRLKRLGYDNIKTKIDDGYYGWEEHAPYDAIIVTAAASHVPPPLIQQLKIGGRMIIPVGSQFMTQELLLIEKEEGGKIITRQVLPVRFVPLTGKH